MSAETYYAAVEYRKMGLINHPLSPPTDKKNSPGKRPLLREWEKIESTSEENLKIWFLDTNNNIGLQCGKRSNVIVIDNDGSPFLNYLFPNGLPNTKQSCRTSGRGHIYFKYTSKLQAQKHHDLGIEILSDGSNAVMPPSVHVSGDVYKWDNPDAPIIEVPDELLTKLEYLFKTESELKIGLSKCRKCFKSILKNKPNFHGAEGRELMIAVCTDLLAKDLKQEHIQLFAKLVYGKDYDAKTTDTELKHIDSSKTWKCETLKAKFPWFINPDECEKCEKHRDEVKEGMKKTTIREPLELPPIPHEVIKQEPITVDSLLEIYKKYLYVEENESITIPLSEVISNFAPIEPDIMGIIGASGSSKTEVIRALGEMENQYIYPVSSITGHTLVSGFEDNIDLAPSLRGRLLTIKDFTTLLAKKADEVSEIFADFRELTDGHIGKDFGSGVKKHYTGLHTSILFGCTNAIEKYNSMFSLLGQRILFFRPRSDRKKAMVQAMKNAGREAAFRDELHKTTMQFINHILNTKKERLTNLSHISQDYKDVIGELVCFLSIVRTHIDRDFKGDMARLPEPEYPTRLAKTLCKLVDAHAVLFDREPNDEDLRIAFRLVMDNIPTERLKILNTLTDGDERTTSEVQEKAKVSNGFSRRVLEDLKALEIIEYFSMGSGRPDIWRFSNEDYREIVIKIQEFSKHDFKTGSPDAEQPQGVNRLPDDTDTFKKVLRKINNNNNKEKSGRIPPKIPPLPVSDLHPGVVRDAEPQQPKHKVENCGICGNPLNGSSEQGPAGLGKVHPECKYLLIPVQFLANIPIFAGIDERPYGPFKNSQIGKIPASNAYALISRKAAARITGGSV